MQRKRQALLQNAAQHFRQLQKYEVERRNSLENTGPREPKKVLKIYTIVEKAGSQRRIWLDIGVASYNRDGSISAKLDALPVTGVIHIREFEPRRTDTFRRNDDKIARQDGDGTPQREWQ